MSDEVIKERLLLDHCQVGKYHSQSSLFRLFLKEQKSISHIWIDIDEKYICYYK